MAETLVKTINGTDVYLTHDGRFRARIKGKNVTLGTIAAMEKKLSAPAVALPVMAVRYQRVDRLSLTGVAQKKSRYYSAPRFLDDEGNEVHGGTVYLPNPAIQASLEDVYARCRVAGEQWDRDRRALNDEERNLTDQLTRVTPDNFRELAAQQEKETA